MRYNRQGTTARRKTSETSLVVGIDVTRERLISDRFRLHAISFCAYLGAKSTAEVLSYDSNPPKFGQLLMDILKHCRAKALFDRYPRKVVLVGHDTAIVLSVLKDSRRLMDQLKENRGSLVTYGKPLKEKGDRGFVVGLLV